MPHDERQTLGLRERKKAKTRASIQQHAFRLFQKQGYEATTVEQIAEAAEVSPSTFFRYFSTKEEVVLWDDLDPLLIAAYEAQPAELSPVQAMRGALRTVFDSLSAEETAQLWERARLILSVPDLRMRMLDQYAGLIDLIADLVAKRLGRRADELVMRTIAGALIGVLLAASFTAVKDPPTDYAELVDASLAYLEAGLPL